MINQEINLYQDRFKEKKLLLSAFNSLLLIGGTVFLLLVSSFFYSDMRSVQEGKYQSNLLLKESSAQRMSALQAKLQTLIADNKIEQQLARVSKDIKVRKRMIDFVDNNQFGSGKGFSENLGALAELKKTDLWLNEISLAGDFLKLSGSALKAESVPEYFGLFQSRELFEGRVFDVFELGRDLQQDWKVDFVIASRALNNE